MLLSAVVLVLFFSGTLWALNRSSRQPDGREQAGDRRDAGLQPVTRTSVIVAPVAVAALAIRDAMEANAPRGLTGKNENPLADLLGKADIGWNISRGPFAVTGVSTGAEHLDHAQRLAPRHRPARQPGRQPHRRARRPARRQLGGDVQKLTTRVLDQRADIRGNVPVPSRPALLPTWRIEPNLSGNVTLGDGGLHQSPASSSTFRTK